MRISETGGTRIVFVDDVGPLISTANDVIGDAWGHEATLIAIPAERLDPAFFNLSSLVAGEFLQKIVNYRLQVAILGDIDAHLERSGVLRDFVWESNRGTQVWFLADEAALTKRLGRG
ncbi:DUF4180 domain-containing protein [Glaciihabitans arcticus]|uniref:DUF4180 domain-containing protein n=1 Tax=Glaciihabitans arcticus TaxID=2668039 RepID=A0A4V2JF42_9MICO|nr:DUF4180 domain-containing protein [Glaciihabitans arcticus]TBN57999.1 DUF4180 domain-containing protein [Glaciihabitans arcticus]